MGYNHHEERKGTMVKKTNIASTITIIVTLVAISMGILVGKNSQTKELVNVTTMGISHITDKYSENSKFYLTVNLDEIVVENYGLVSKTYSFKTNEHIYNNISVNDDYSGLTLKITVPNNNALLDIDYLGNERLMIGSVLKGNYRDVCEIISVTDEKNEIIC